MTPKRINALLWFLCLSGLLATLFFAFPEEGIIDIKTVGEGRERNLSFEIPDPRPRRTSGPLDRAFLFELAGNDKLNGVARERRIESRYEHLCAKIDSDRVPLVTLDTSLGVATLKIDEEPLVTVLPQDCPEYYNRLSDANKALLEQEVAETWRRVLQDDLHLRTLQRHPVYLSLYNFLGLFLFFVVAMTHLTMSWAGRRFFRQPLWSLKALLWVVYFSVLTALHPSLGALANFLAEGALRPLFLFVGCALLISVFQQITLFWIQRYFRVLADYQQDRGNARAIQRRNTLEQVAGFVARLVWVLAGSGAYFYLLGVDLGAFFAGAGLVGVAIGVIGRDVLLDFFSGINILAEDQFGMGDWIESNTDEGEVVRFSLRSTQIRKTDGSLATLPNSDLRRVKNHSNEWAQVDFRVTVTYATDTDRALDLLVEEAVLLDQQMPGLITAPPSPLGVQALGLDGVVLRMLLRTVPLSQWAVMRALNARVKRRFDAEGIEFAAPRRSLQGSPGFLGDARATVHEHSQGKDQQQTDGESSVSLKEQGC